MISRAMDFLLDLRDRQRIAIALSKGAMKASSRQIDLREPETWEFSGFSQNGEDGILDVLRNQMSAGNHYFVELGSADGIENNTTWLAVVEKFGGIMVEGNPALAHRAERTVARLSIGAEVLNQFVTVDSVSAIAELALLKDPEVFSLDIDGNDYHVAQALIGSGLLRPRIAVVEYNAAFGPDKRITIPYESSFAYSSAHESELYYGVSIAAWKVFFDRLGYRFVTVDRNGVNAFFVDPAWFDAGFLNSVSGKDFAENQFQFRKFREPWSRQFERISRMPFHDVD